MEYGPRRRCRSLDQVVASRIQTERLNRIEQNQQTKITEIFSAFPLFAPFNFGSVSEAPARSQNLILMRFIDS